MKSPDTGLDASPVRRIEFDAHAMRVTRGWQRRGWDRGHGVAIAIAITVAKRSGIRTNFRRRHNAGAAEFCAGCEVQVIAAKDGRGQYW